jgi:hypothetical protein
MEKNRGDEPIWVTIHIYTWKYHNETSLNCYLRQTKMAFFKNTEPQSKQVLPGGWYQQEGEEVRKGYRRVNAMEIIMHSCMKIEK